MPEVHVSDVGLSSSHFARWVSLQRRHTKKWLRVIVVSVGPGGATWSTDKYITAGLLQRKKFRNRESGAWKGKVILLLVISDGP